MSLRIGFAGAGGVGCYFGGVMARAGLDVTLMGRGHHIAAIAEHGLTLNLNGETSHIDIKTIDTENSAQVEAARFDWLFVTTKAHQTESIVEAMRPAVVAGAKVVSLQNGVEGAKELSRLLGVDVYGGLSIRFVAHRSQPGCVDVEGDGYIEIGKYPAGDCEAVKLLAERMTHSGIYIRYTDDIRKALWRKLIINNGVNPICALLLKDCEEVFTHVDTAMIVDDMMREAAMAAAGDGVQLDESDIEAFRSIIRGLGPVKPSMLVDREAGRTMELDAICGPVIRNAQAIGKRAAVTETINRLLSSV